MPINVTCPSCLKSGRVPHEVVGKQIKCPRCGERFKAGADEIAPASIDDMVGAWSQPTGQAHSATYQEDRRENGSAKIIEPAPTVVAPLPQSPTVKRERRKLALIAGVAALVLVLTAVIGGAAYLVKQHNRAVQIEAWAQEKRARLAAEEEENDAARRALKDVAEDSRRQQEAKGWTVLAADSQIWESKTMPWQGRVTTRISRKGGAGGTLQINFELREGQWVVVSHKMDIDK